MLDEWIDPRLLSPGARDEARRSFATDRDRLLVVDHLLREERFQTLARCFRDHLVWRQEHKLYRTAGFVKAEVWAAAPVEDRFLTNDFAVGPRPGSRESEDYRAHCRFVQLLGSPAFARFLAEITGSDLGPCDGIRVKAFSADHFLRPHSDADPARALCGVLYTSPAWPREDRGAFEIHWNGVCTRTVPYRPNRLLVFDPHAGHEHAIGAMDQRCERRFNYSFWFKRPGAPR
jgi:hypothetical protein